MEPKSVLTWSRATSEHGSDARTFPPGGSFGPVPAAAAPAVPSTTDAVSAASATSPIARVPRRALVPTAETLVARSRAPRSAVAFDRGLPQVPVRSRRHVAPARDRAARRGRDERPRSGRRGPSDRACRSARAASARCSRRRDRGRRRAGAGRRRARHSSSGRRYSVMNPSTRCCSTVISGSSASGSVASTFWSTACSTTDRCANARPRDERVSRSGASATASARRAKKRSISHPTVSRNSWSRPPGNVPVDRRPRQARGACDVVDGRLRQPEPRDAVVRARVQAITYVGRRRRFEGPEALRHRASPRGARRGRW